MFDVVVIGAGVSGCSIARELSRFDASVCVLEKEEDVCCGTSKANSAIVHAGFDPQTGSLMAELNLKGNLMMEGLAKDLDIPFIKNGSLVVCTDESMRKGLEDLLERGKKNGVKDLRIIERDELAKLEPNISDSAVAALYAPTGGIICPFTLNIALAENACKNGVEFRFDSEVTGIEKTNGGFLIKTKKETIETKSVVNAAGVYADRIHNFVSKNKMKLVPRKGEYCLLDKTAGKHVTRTIFALPGKMGKGILVSPTVHGNLLVGPTAEDVDDKDGINTTSKGLASVISGSALTVKNIPMRQVITSFAGLRAHHEKHEFIIEETKDVPFFFDCAAIESPGLTACPAIGVKVSEMVAEKLKLGKKKNFVSTRKGILKPNNLSIEERNRLIKKNPAYGNIICRCESITEGEIVDALKRPVGAHSLDGVKRRTRAGMGRCQSGFCSPKVMEIITRELKIENVTKTGGKSKIIPEDSE